MKKQSAKKLFFAFLLLSLYCKSMEQKIISKEQEYSQSQDLEKKEEIIQEMYKKKDQVPDELKDKYVDFFINKDSDSSKKILSELYKDPEYKNQKEKILNYHLNHIDENNIALLKKELAKNPELYTLSVKQKLLALGTKEAAEIILNQIYLEREELDGEILYLFRKTQFTDSLPVIIKSIENQKFVEEGFLTISDFRVEEADLFLINVSSDWNHPYRELGVAYLYKIDNKPLAISIYKDILKNQIEQKNLVLKSLNGLEKIIDNLTEKDKKEIRQLLPQIKKKYSGFNLDKLEFAVLENTENQKDFINEDIKIQQEQTRNNKKEQKPKLEQEIKKESKKVISEVIQTKKSKEEQILEKNKSEKKEKVEENKSYNNKQKTEEPKKDNRYVQNLEKKFYGIFKQDTKEVITNIHNSLLSYSSSNSEKARFVIKAYENCYKISEEEKIRNYLKQGLFLKNSFSCILNYIDNQYRREDQKIFAFQEFFVLKRKHSEMIIKHKSKLK